MSAVSSDVAFRRFAERACVDEKLELEIGIDMPISMMMFQRLVRELYIASGQSASETLQLDIIYESTRLEFHGKQLIERLVKASSKCVGSNVPPTRILMKRREMAPVSHEEYDYTVRLKREMDLEPGARDITLDAFRLKRRFSFAIGQCRVDCTAVQEKKKHSQRTPAASPDAPALKFEVEVEFVGARAQEPQDQSTKTRSQESDDPDAIVTEMSSIAVRCMGVMLGTSQPVARSDTIALAAHLRDASPGRDAEDVTRGLRLLGPQPVTLEMHHVDASAQQGGVLGGRYTVTDKADGVRCHMLTVSQRAYTLDAHGVLRLVAVNVPRDGDGAILDGELLTVSKHGGALNVFVAFDVYKSRCHSCYDLPLCASDEDGRGRTRVDEMNAIVAAMKIATKIDGFDIESKTIALVRANDSSAIANTFRSALTKRYATDGLIFTPAYLPVGARHEHDVPNPEGTWPLALKWKPPEFNTIDFLLKVSSEFSSESGPVTVEVPSSHRRSRVYDACASYIPRKWEDLDVSQYIRFGERAFPGREAEAKKFEVEGAPHRALVYVPLNDAGVPSCEDGSVLYGNANVVECVYRRDPTGRWVPLRVRHEKTARLANGIAGAANDWGTALNVWRSTQNPVTLQMLTGAQPPIPSPTPDGDSRDGNSAYYAERHFNRRESILNTMANFHNVVIKDKLYEKARTTCAAAGAAGLFEMACGKGGDMSRWATHGFDPIVGVDSCMDNIVNSLDGVYARLASQKSKFADKTAVFVCMDATTRMRPPLDEIRVAASESPHGDVIAAMWDTSLHPMTNTALTPLRGVVTKGFDVVSCQFALHYMFQDDTTLDRFVRNVDYLLRPGGVLCATCFDGDRVARALENNADSDGRSELRGRTGSGSTAWSIVKRYDGNFAGGTGAGIDVFVETINQTVREYLVSARTLEARLAQIGLRKVFHIPFSTHFHQSQPPLSELEKRLSAFNSAFMFKRAEESDAVVVDAARRDAARRAVADCDPA